MLLDLESLVNLHEMDINGILHIGAHYGQEYEVYKKLNIENILFFEPLPNNFKILEEKFKDIPSIKLFNKALGNSTTKIPMYVEKQNNGQSSSILKPELHLIQYPHITFEHTETVDMVRLDDLEKNKEFDLNKFNMINIDVQGYELEVFKGSENILNNIDYIMTEVNRANLYTGCALVEQLDEYLSKYGFKRVVTSWEGVTWGEALYIKEQHVDF